MGKYNYEQNRNDYLTPPEIIEKTLKKVSSWTGEDVKEFDLDVCCTHKNVPAKNYFVAGEKDGLLEEWEELNWCNPPFNECAKWVKKAYEEQQKEKITVMLIPARTETAYFHKYILHNKQAGIEFLRKGLRFTNADTKEPMGIFKNALAIVYFW